MAEQKTEFNQAGMRSSMVGWIRGFPSAEAVQEADAKELAEINGSYGAIADRMQQMWDFADEYNNQGKAIVPYEEWEKVIDPVVEKYKRQYGEAWSDRDSGAWKAYCEEWAILRASFHQTHLDNKVAVLQYLSARGLQVCPFEPCNLTWNEDVSVLSRKNNRKLTINRGTIHMAREHGFLEKGNDYGITAREFYESFM